MTGLAGAGIAFGFPSCARGEQAAAGELIDVVERFGFVADGRTDNYQAFHRWARHVNTVGGGAYRFPAGTYHVGSFRRFAGRAAEARTNPTLIECDGLIIHGEGAKIVLNGNFHRAARKAPDGAPLGSHMATIIPFELKRCSDVTISGFEIDGGVRGMSRDESVAEAYAPLVCLRGSRNVRLQDLNLHHSQTDAIMLYVDEVESRGPRRACRDISLTRVRCANNARGALAPIQVYGLTCTDCTFSGSGMDLGRYAAHSPGFGVDVEPDYHNSRDVDTKTGNLEFRNCAFNDNVSAFLAAYSTTYRGYLRLIDCSSTNRGNHPNHMIFSWPGATISGGVHDAGVGTVWVAWQAGAGGDLQIRDCEFRVGGPYGIYHPHDGNQVRMERVKVVGTHRRPTHGSVLYLGGNPGGGRKNLLRSCDVFIPAARKSPEHAYDYEVVLHHTISEGNRFRTDLPSGRGHFCTDYGAGAIVRGDSYRGTAPGSADSFRPDRLSGHDTRRPFSTN